MSEPARTAAARPRPANTGDALDGPALFLLFRAASRWLDHNAEAINAINVYPVPDGDTGSNLAATLRDALAAIAGAATATDVPEGAGAVAEALARGALLSARGNSGVILSQLLGGFAAACGGAERIDAPLLAAALEHGARVAYSAVRTPQEGTILTVAREAGEEAARHTEEGLTEVAEAALATARDALARTPDLLPVLKQAGVVDSGGLGYVVILEGFVQGLRGESAPVQGHVSGRIAAGWLDEAIGHGSTIHRYCTEFVAETAGEATALREWLEALGDSVLVVGAGGLLHAHVHTDDPGAALQRGTALGALLKVKVENMQAQAAQLAASSRDGGRSSERDSGRTAGIAVVAVVSGAGLAQVARSLGATSVVLTEGGTNPSVQQILGAVAAAGAETVIVLPNHNNVILAADQAAQGSQGARQEVSVVPTRSIPQGMSALLAFDPGRSLAETAAAMREAAAHVRTVEVTRAARDTTAGGDAVPRGAPIALIDGEPRLSAETPLEALARAVAEIAPAPGAALTVYGGAGVDAATLADAGEELRARFPEIEVETIAGGQPHYDFIAGVE